MKSNKILDKLDALMSVSFQSLGQQTMCYMGKDLYSDAGTRRPAGRTNLGGGKKGFAAGDCNGFAPAGSVA